MLESGVVDLRPLITHEMGFERIEEAMGLLAGGDACKIILRPAATVDTTPVDGAERGDRDPNVEGRVVHR